MANMSYCRFQNTLGDLIDCKNAVMYEDIEDFSADEKKALIRLIKVCQYFAESDLLECISEDE